MYAKCNGKPVNERCCDPVCNEREKLYFGCCINGWGGVSARVEVWRPRYVWEFVVVVQEDDV